ncbi:MAG: NitT/TauT family transport system substrate-binding protein [Halieaceae bacterium]|jgi:NitT/TauT family transport system substrate-binding protein
MRGEEVVKAGSASMRALLFPVMFVFTAFLPGCRPPVELQISVHSWVGYQTLSLAEEFGWLPGGAVIHHTASASESVARLLDGSAHVAALTLDEALRLREQQPRLAVVLVMNESAGADVILARPGIDSLPALAGARIAYEALTVGEILLGSALAVAGLSEGDIELVNLPLAEHEAAYRAGDIDVVVTYPPSADLIVVQGARLLYDSRAIPGTIFGVLVVDRSTLANRQELLAATVAAHFRALAYLRSNREDAIYRYAQYQDVPADSIRKSLAGVRLPGLPRVRAYLAQDGAVDRAAAGMIEAGLVAVNDDVLDELVVDRYLPRAAF